MKFAVLACIVYAVSAAEKTATTGKDTKDTKVTGTAEGTADANADKGKNSADGTTTTGKDTKVTTAGKAKVAAAKTGAEMLAAAAATVSVAALF